MATTANKTPSEKSSSAPTPGILLMAYGAAGSLEEIAPYLNDIRGGRAIPAEFIEEIKERYRAIGGKSPLLDITQAQASALQRQLATRYKVFFGMRHWRPYIKETVAAMKTEGVAEFTAICLTPYYSALSVGAYRKKLEEALGAVGGNFSWSLIPSWHDEPGLIEAFAEKIRQAMKKFSRREHDKIQVIFSAHSLPQKILEMNDPYPKQLLETSRLVAQQTGLAPGQWYFAYQNQSKTSEPWLGPNVSQTIERLAQEKHRRLLLCPVGFLTDHLETLYDVDILYKRQAESCGIEFSRTESPNGSPTLISALANVIERHAREKKANEAKNAKDATGTKI